MDDFDLVIKREGLPLLKLALLLFRPDVFFRSDYFMLIIIMHSLCQFINVLLISLDIICRSDLQSGLLSILEKIFTILSDFLSQL